MKEITGNIWDYHQKGNYILVTTNGSVTDKGACIMGRGIALQAKERFPKLPKMLGTKIKATGNFPHIFPEYKIITFPVKRRYFEMADLKLIEYSAIMLVKALEDPRDFWRTRDDILWNMVVHDAYLPARIDNVYMVRPGCSNGRRNWESEVKPILSPILDDRFIVVNNE
jgi:hypothetical protein